MSNGRSCSLLSLLLMVTLGAAIAGLFAMRQRVIQAEKARDSALAERDELRAKFGHIEVNDESRTYFAPVKSYEGEDTFRAIFPAGSRYLLHISDTPMNNSEVPDDLPRTKTMSMNGWREGADIILKWGVWGGDSKRFVVSTQTDELFDYQIENWNAPAGHPNESFDVASDQQVSFATSERVILSYFGNEKLQRGIVLWLEPHADWEEWNERRKAKSK